MIHDNTAPEEGIYKFLYSPSRVLFFPISLEHLSVAVDYEATPTHAGAVAIGNDFFCICSDYSSSTGLRVDRDAIIGLEAFLGKVFRESGNTVHKRQTDV